MDLRERILSGVASQACRRAKIVILVAALLTAGSIAAVLLRGRISTDLADILPHDSEEAALFVEATERFAADILLVALEADDPEDIQAAKPYADLLAEKLARKTEYVRMVEHRVGEQLLEFARDLAEKRGYLFLDETDIALLKHKLSTEAIHGQMAENRRRLDAAGVEYFRTRIVPDPLDLVELLERRRIQAAGQFAPKEGEDYVVSPDGRMLLMIVQATKSVKDLAFDRAFMAEVLEAERETWEELAAGTAPSYGATMLPLRERLRVGHGGGYAIAVDQNRVLTRDIQLTAITSLVGVLVLFALAFKRMGALFYIGTPLVASILWTLAVAFLVFDHISVMSAGFAAILIGLSVDYAIHIYNRYIAERERGLEVEGAIHGAIVHAGSGIFFGALTTAVAFFAIAFTRFVGLSEFGVLAGVGVVLGMLAMLFLQPAMLVVRNRIRQEPLRVVRAFGFGLNKLADLIDRHPWKVFAFSTVLALAAVAYVANELTVFFFDSDFKKLGAESEVFKLQRRVEKEFRTNLGGMVALSRGATEDEALAKAGLVGARAQILMEGELAAEVPSPGPGKGRGGGRRPWVRAQGCTVRLRRAEIVLPEDAKEPEGLTAGVESHTRADGRRVVVYDFRSEDQLGDWTFEGEHRLLAGVDLAPGAVARWGCALKGAFAVTFSLWFQGGVESVTLGAGEGLSATVGGAKRDAPLTQWPPELSDQVRFTLMVEPGEGAKLYVARGTLMSVDSVAAFVPPLSVQKASAEFVSAVDVDRIERDVAAAAREQGIRPRAFRNFARQLRGMVERAAEPEYLTPAELRASRAGAVLSKYFAVDEHAPPDRRHTVATFLYPERGEMDRPWYARVRRTIGDAADVSAHRLVSLEIRDIVWNDFWWITTFVIVGVMVSLVWSFKSVVWPFPALMPLIFGFAMLLATLLLIGHQLNLVNVLIFPAIVGIGIDNAIHVIHRFRESGRVRDIVTETGRALVLTSLTTMIGFGSLMVSRYRGLRSLGFVAALGMFFCLYSSLVTLPALLAGLAKRGAEREGDTR